MTRGSLVVFVMRPKFGELMLRVMLSARLAKDGVFVAFCQSVRISKLTRSVTVKVLLRARFVLKNDGPNRYLWLRLPSVPGFGLCKTTLPCESLMTRSVFRFLKEAGSELRRGSSSLVN